MDLGSRLGSWRLSIVLMVAAGLYYGFLAIWATSSPPHVVQNIASLAPFWIVYGLLRTESGVSPNVGAGSILASLIMFGGVYLLLLALAACEDDPFALSWENLPDTAMIYSRARPELYLPTGYNFVSRSPVLIESPTFSTRWDLILDTVEGEMVFLPPRTFGVVSTAGINVAGSGPGGTVTGLATIEMNNGSRTMWARSSCSRPPKAAATSFGSEASTSDINP